MKRFLLFTVVLIAASMGAAIAQDGHVLTSPKEMKWSDPPPVFEKGATFTVLSGDPGKEGIYVVRLKMPAGYKINPHWHPTDEHVTVITGTFALGMGEKFDAAAMKDLPAGGYALRADAALRHVEDRVDRAGPRHGPFADLRQPGGRSSQRAK
jgi:hypothetical protein